MVRFTPLPLHPPRTHCIGGWVDPRAGLDLVEKKKSRTENNQTQALQSVASLHAD